MVNREGEGVRGNFYRKRSAWGETQTSVKKQHLLRIPEPQVGTMGSKNELYVAELPMRRLDTFALVMRAIVEQRQASGLLMLRAAMRE